MKNELTKDLNKDVNNYRHIFNENNELMRIFNIYKHGKYICQDENMKVCCGYSFSELKPWPYKSENDYISLDIQKEDLKKEIVIRKFLFQIVNLGLDKLKEI